MSTTPDTQPQPGDRTALPKKQHMTRSPVRPALALAAYIATIPAANLMIEHYGTVPVGPDLVAPAGVYMVGVALVLRDLVRESAGLLASLCAVFAGAVLSWFLAAPLLAIASGVAFLVSELLDFAVYEPLRRRGLVLAMGVSNAFGIVADSLIFLWLAFGSWAFLPGQLAGKAWMTLAAIAVIALIRRHWAQAVTV